MYGVKTMVEYVRTENLKPGDIIAKSLYDENGRTLLMATKTLTETAIRVIRQYGYKGVYNMEMLQLRYFYESAKTESITQTAKKYMVPTSSVSSSISRLEEELGVKLFNRTSNRITLNEKGRQFFKSISHIFSELDNAVGNLTVEEEDNRKIHILVRANRDTLVRRIVDYNARHPKSAFKLNFDFAETDYDKYEIIIEEKNDKHPDYEGFELFQHQYRIRINASTDNPLCQRKLNLKQLYNQPFISTGEQNDIYKIVVRACNRVGFTPELIMDCND